MADVAGLRPWAGHLPYSIAKACVIALTRGLAQELAPSVRVNAVAPGFVRTEMLAKLPPEVLEREKEVLREQAVASGKPEAVLGRIVEGKLAKFYEENCLYEQHFIKDVAGGQTIGELINSKIAKFGENITVRRFSRFKVGEGVTKSPAEASGTE